MRGVPGSSSSVVTFVMTDIESSTLMWRSDPEGMKRAQRRHDELMAEWTERCNGFRPVQQGEGDSTVMVFSDPSDALDCALGLQLAFRDEPWPTSTPIRVRMALATGPAELRDDNYFGIGIIRCARLRNIGHGGQILVFLDDRDALSARTDVTFDDLGMHRLKDLDAPERVFQVVHEGLERDFPALRSLDRATHNLPAPLTSFVGREREVADILDAHGRARLVVLLGIGGIGKTRLALQVGERLAAQVPDGVWFVDVAAVSTSADVIAAVASAVGVRAQPGRSLTETVIDHLRPREATLIFDGCEHVLDGCARVADALLAACPSLRIVATSRVSLGFPGSLERRIDPLPLEDDAAIRLFVERAQAADPSFDAGAERAAVAAICARLEGIPLAIELAAARVNVLSPPQIEQRLRDRYSFLTPGLQVAAQRRGTLESVLSWSYELLSEAHRSVLARSSVFVRGFTVEAAESVCAGEGIEASDVADAVAALIDTSLVVVSTGPLGRRCAMLELVRDYAARKLTDADPVRDRHADWFIARAEHAAEELVRSGGAPFLDEFDAEHENLRAAFEWTLQRDDTERALRLAGAMWGYWVWRGHPSEGREWLDRALPRAAEASPAVAGKAMRAAGVLAGEQGDFDAARGWFGGALDLAQVSGDRSAEAWLLNDFGVLSSRDGSLDEARTFYERSLQIHRELHDDVGVSYALGNLGVALGRLGDTERARALLEESLAIDEALGHHVATAGTLTALGEIALAERDAARARSLFERALRLHVELGAREYLAASLEGLAHVMLDEGAGDDAARLVGAAEGVRERVHLSVAPSARADRERLLQRLADAVGEDAFSRARQEGREAAVDDMIRLALGERGPS